MDLKFMQLVTKENKQRRREHRPRPLLDHRPDCLLFPILNHDIIVHSFHRAALDHLDPELLL
jgi:hypothetical protein